MRLRRNRAGARDKSAAPEGTGTPASSSTTFRQRLIVFAIKRAIGKDNVFKILDFFSGYKTIIGATGVVICTIGEFLSHLAGATSLGEIFTAARQAATGFAAYGLALKTFRSKSKAKA